MNKELTDIRRSIRNSLIRLRFLDARRSARWICDRFQFGSGSVERLTAAVVLAGLFMLIVLGFSVILQLPVGTTLSLCGVALGTAILTSTMLVLGPTDDDLIGKRTATIEELEDAKVRAAELKEKIAEQKAKKANQLAKQKVKEARRVAEEEDRRRRTCPYCGKRIEPWTKKCPHCREYLDEDLARERAEAIRTKSNTGVAAVLSFIIPGLGQIYKRQVFAGLIWWFLIWSVYVASLLTLGCCIGFAGIPIAIVLHMICVFDAASGEN